jgi:hypothetical protein
VYKYTTRIGILLLSLNLILSACRSQQANQTMVPAPSPTQSLSSDTPTTSPVDSQPVVDSAATTSSPGTPEQTPASEAPSAIASPDCATPTVELASTQTAPAEPSEGGQQAEQSAPITSSTTGEQTSPNEPNLATRQAMLGEVNQGPPLITGTVEQGAPPIPGTESQVASDLPATAPVPCP